MICHDGAKRAPQPKAVTQVTAFVFLAFSFLVPAVRTAL
jgi:hypothetical protein